MFRFRALTKMKFLSFLFLAKEKFKNRGLEGFSPECPLFNNKKISSLLSCYLKILARVNGIFEKLILRKTRNKVFQCSTSLFEISLLIYLIFLHYSSGFIDSFYVDILCLNCNHDSSYVDVTPCRICFVNFWLVQEIKLYLSIFFLFKTLV